MSVFCRWRGNRITCSPPLSSGASVASAGNQGTRTEPWLFISPPSQHTERGEQLLQLAGALMQLPEAQREVFILRYLNGWAVKDIAAHPDKNGVKG
jgi:DNA-directed RNA polymerase specialized sigma24 family protein